MARKNVLILGALGAGKTTIARCLNNVPFELGCAPTTASDILFVDRDDVHLNLWAPSGSNIYTKLRLDLSHHKDLILYCIDLSKEYSQDNIKKEIEELRELNPSINIILVATKCAVENRVNASARLAELSGQVGSDKFIVTCAEDGYGLNGVGEEEKLFTLMVNSLPLHTTALSPVSDLNSNNWDAPELLIPAVENLRSKLQYNQRKCNQISKKLQELLTHLKNIEPLKGGQSAKYDARRDLALKSFTKQCQTILEGESPYLMNAIYILASAVVVGGIVTLGGFYLGIASTYLIISSVVSATGSAGLMGYSLFRESTYIRNAFNDFSDQVINPSNLNLLLINLRNYASETQVESIREAHKKLVRNIGARPENTVHEVSTFVTRCHVILEGAHPVIMGTLYSLAATALVAGLVALAGFYLAVPVVPLLIASGVLGTVTGGIVAHGLFKQSKYIEKTLSDFNSIEMDSIAPLPAPQSVPV